MLKISTKESNDQLSTLRLEGRIAGPWTSELRKVCERLLSENRTVRLILADVMYLDHSGVELLQKLQSRGVLLSECSPFTAEQLKARPS